MLSLIIKLFLIEVLFMEYMDSIGERIRWARKNKKLTMTEVSELTGLSTGNISELENNKFMPSSTALLSFKKVLDVSIDWLLTGEENVSVNYNCFQPSENKVSYTVKEASETVFDLSEEEIKLVQTFRMINEEKRRDILGYINICLSSDKDHKS